MTKLQGKICCLRGWLLSDEEALIQYADNSNVTANLFDRFPSPFTVKAAQQWLNSQQGLDKPTYLAIDVGGESVGGIGIDLKTDVYRRQASIGYWLGEPFWGKGIATEAIILMTAYAFANFDLVRLQAGVFETNPASMRVLDKAGFVKEAVSKKAVFKKGQMLDEHVYTFIKQE